MVNGDDEVDDNIVVDRTCIGCDNCGIGSPQKCCARCGLFYYCSKECQVTHWKQHKKECTKIKKAYDDWKKSINNVVPTPDTNDEPCAICLEETITNPVVLPCGHAFCRECVESYQISSMMSKAKKDMGNPCPWRDDAPSCPYCRREIPNFVDGVKKRMKAYMDLAFSAPEGSEKQKKYSKLAIAEFDFIDEITPYDENDTNSYIRNMASKVRIMPMTGQPDKTIQMAKELLSLNEKYPGALSFIVENEAKRALAEAYSACSQWKDASKIYKALYDEYNQCGVSMALVTKGLIRAKYNMGKYDEAIEFGMKGIEVGRYHQEIHKYIALSQKAQGDIDEAKKTISRALLYEYHWDKDNLQKNKQILRDLNNL